MQCALVQNKLEILCRNLYLSKNFSQEKKNSHKQKRRTNQFCNVGFDFVAG